MDNTRAWNAHGPNAAGSAPEPIAEHVLPVARRAAEAAAAFGAEKEAELAGVLHDLGKCSDLFQKRLLNQESRLDHWSIGAYAALAMYREKALAAALAIQGHHIGLQEGSGSAIRSSLDIDVLSDARRHPLQLKLTERDHELLLQRLRKRGIAPPASPERGVYNLKGASLSAMLDVRMLFSALVDADFVETEAHFQGKADGTKVYRTEGPELRAAEALRTVMEHLEALRRRGGASADVRRMRQELLNSCLAAALGPPGIMTLTAPTGAGKTLAMLAFALKHATAHPQFRRIVMIVPFLSIIEQTAGVYRRLLAPRFGPQYVLEHHSLAGVTKKGDNQDGGDRDRDNENEARRTARLLAENWDAPLVLTTSVQFFESLFANRSSKCRKLHRLANSVILFDEVQTLPRRLAVPSLAALSRLAERYGCSVVFSTATQPAFDHLDKQVRPHAAAGWAPKNVVEAPSRLFGRARRVRVEWRTDERLSWNALADELARSENEQVLCVVNLKRHAQALVDGLRARQGDDGLFHLSTNMCPAHRERTLESVRARLSADKPLACRLISTQCIEAGVDVDFPVAYRAFGPLDAIAQVAGRCNREGRLEAGRMVVFAPEPDGDGKTQYPPGGYKEAADTTRTLIELKRKEAQRRGVPFEEVFDIYAPALFDQYYRCLYDLTGETDFAPERNDLAEAVARRSFVCVARQYRLIENNTINVLVPYEKEMELFESLKERLAEDGRLTRQWIQDARPLTVGLYRPNRDAPVWNLLDPAPLGRGEKADDWFVYLNSEDYDSLLGLKSPSDVDTWMI